MPSKTLTPPPFLVDLLKARSPSGYEFEAQAVVDRYLKPLATDYRKDAMGNRLATLNPKGDPILMLAGHMDELGFIIKYIDSKGFIYFDTIGGQDVTLFSGRRVSILTQSRDTVKGVTGKRAIHLLTLEERRRLPKIHDIWIDIGARSREEAEKVVSIGDPIIYDQGFELLRGTIAAARAFDDKAGCYVVCETLRRLAKIKSLVARVTAVATTQEEIGTRGASTAAYAVNPHIAIAVDVGHATDHPDCKGPQHGERTLSGGPIICRGPNINPQIFESLIKSARQLKIPYQVEADPRPTGTDARVLQIAREGVATGLISIPLRYMHTPGEVVDLKVVEDTVRLLTTFAKSLKKGEYGHW